MNLNDRSHVSPVVILAPPTQLWNQSASLTENTCVGAPHNVIGCTRLLLLWLAAGPDKGGATVQTVILSSAGNRGNCESVVFTRSRFNFKCRNKHVQTQNTKFLNSQSFSLFINLTVSFSRTSEMIQQTKVQSENVVFCFLKIFIFT